MKQVNLYEAKTQLSKLVDEAAGGEEIVIAKNGKPAARLVPLVEARSKEPRKLGQWAQPGQEVDFDKWWREWKESDKEIEADFEASIAKPFPGLSDDADAFHHRRAKPKKIPSPSRTRRRKR